MIDYKGQMKMSFSIGPFEDFIAEEQMSQLKMVEGTGNIMPAIEIKFKTKESGLLAYLNETNTLKVQLGVKEIKYDLEFKIKNKHIDMKSKGDYDITLRALMNNHSYSLVPQRRTFGNATSDGRDISGLEVILCVANENFSRIETNITKSDDYMLRIQPGISNKQFVDEVWETLYTPDTFVAMGITSSGKFKLADIKALSATNPKWKFTYKPSEAKDITPEQNMIDDNSGVNNYLFGYIRQREFYDEDNGESFVSTTGNTTYLSMSDHFGRDDVWMLNTQMARNDNMYNEYWEARDTNLSNLALFSSINNQFCFSPDWHDIEILDLVYIESIDLNENPEEAYSGLAIVSGVSRIYANKKITTYVSLNREGFNQTK